MKKKISIIILIIFYLVIPFYVFAQPQFEISRNIYRVPYLTGTDVHISRDHYTHTPVGRYDMSGNSNGSSCSSNYTIVAAAAGYVRRIVDNHDVHGPDCTSNCSDYNNYVWIEHANGEWTKYTHMKKNSTTINAGLVVGEFVEGGQMLGYECEIGAASGPHLHFEVRHPNNPSNVQISTLGGFMDDADHRIPAICGQTKNYFEGGDDVTSSGCPSCNTAVGLFMSNLNFVANKVYAKLVGGTITTSTNVTFSSTSSTLLQSSTSIIFTPGLTVNQGAYFSARVGSCGTTPY
jgi:murein DD-endopeptidase MepM/ murein hydrolase activator NlpD